MHIYSCNYVCGGFKVVNVKNVGKKIEHTIEAALMYIYGNFLGSHGVVE